MSGGALGSDQLTAVGDLGAAILAGVPEAFRTQVEPFIPALVGAIHEAFSLATAGTFLVGIATSLAAAGLVLLLREAPAPALAGGPQVVHETEAHGPERESATRPRGHSGREVPVPVEIEDEMPPGVRH
jgi:hypothetical protein